MFLKGRDSPLKKLVTSAFSVEFKISRYLYFDDHKKVNLMNYIPFYFLINNVIYYYVLTLSVRIGVFRESMGLSESFHQMSTCADLTCSWRVPAKATGRHTWVIIIMFVRSWEVILHFFKGYEVHLWGWGVWIYSVVSSTL